MRFISPYLVQHLSINFPFNIMIFAYILCSRCTVSSLVSRVLFHLLCLSGFFVLPMIISLSKYFVCDHCCTLCSYLKCDR